MFLRSLTLENFKCLENIDISFEKSGLKNRQWTLVLGENGTGKSNLLKAIALVTAGSNALGELIGPTDNWIRSGQKSCSIFAVVETKKRELREVSLKIELGDHLSNIITKNHDSLKLIDDAIAHTDRNYFVVAYGSSRRLSKDVFSTQEPNRSPRFVNVRNLFDNTAVLNPLTSWILELDYRTGVDGIELVRETLDGFLPGITFNSIDKERKAVLFDTVDGVIPLDHLSDGYQNMAAWIGDLLFRITETFKDYKKPLETRGLLLIDEIDLHLHPRWQRKLLEFIGNKLPNFQVVATTHSPLTAQQANEGELFALKRNSENKVELLPFIGSPKSLLLNQLLMTPVFGLISDESYLVQTAKQEYEELKTKDAPLNADEKKTFSKAKKTIADNLPKRAFSPLNEKEASLLEKIEAELRNK